MFEQTQVTTRQAGTFASGGPAVALQQQRYREPSGFRIGLFRFLRVVKKIFSSLSRVLLIVFGLIGVVMLLAVMAAIILGIAAANGAVMMLIGNGILRAAHLSHYTTNKVAAGIGAVGGLFTLSVFVTVLPCFMSANSLQENKPAWVTFLTTVLIGMLDGTFGAAFLKYYQVDLHGMDVWHAARVGALGGAIFVPGSSFIGGTAFFALGIILSPLWIAALCSIGWVQLKLSESWTDDSRGDSIRYFGDDPEINAGLDYLYDFRRRQGGF